MSDRFILKPNCSACGTDLHPEDKDTLPLMMAVGDSLDLPCPQCGTVWRFWLEVTTQQKKIGVKKKSKNKSKQLNNIE